MNFRQLRDCVVIEHADAETRSTGGIIIADTAGEKPQRGEAGVAVAQKIVDAHASHDQGGGMGGVM